MNNIKKIKKYKKSSEVLGRNILLVTAFATAIVTATGVILNVTYKEPTYEVEYVDSVDDKQPVVLVENIIEPEVIEHVKSTNMDEARLILEDLDEITIDDIEDEDLKQEMIDDKISIYFEALQKVNEANVYEGTDIAEFANNNYDLYDGINRNSDKILSYNALVYQKLLDNDADINEAVEEMHKLMILQTAPTELDEETWNKTFSVLLSTLDEEKHESLNIYFPLAYDLHRITCDKEHNQEYGVILCENLEDEYSKLR